MKLALFLSFWLTVPAFAELSGQTVDLDVRNASFKSVIVSVQKQTGYSFTIHERYLSDAQPVTLTLRHVEVLDALPLIFRDQPFSYTVNGRIVTIAVGDKESNTEPSALILAYPEIRGRIVDSLGTPLSGASVRVLDPRGRTTVIQARTDANGYFLLRNVPQDSRIQVSYVGYVPADLPAKADMGTITLFATPSVLNEVKIDAGYYSVTERERTGNISRVTAAEIERQPVSNPLAALVGRVAGLDITQESGMPGSGFTIRLRGLNSVRPGANAPLIVIDGVPFPVGGTDNADGVLPGYALEVAVHPLSTFDPNDIASVSVLKDADATSIYGSRGANGVILITTKRGHARKSTLNLNLISGFSRIGSRLELLDRRQYLDMRYEAIANDGHTLETAPPTTIRDLLTWDTTRYTDWQEELLGGTAAYHRAQLSLAGGNNTTSFNFAGNYNLQTTILPTSRANDGYHGRLSVNHSAPDGRLTARFSASYGVSTNRLPGAGIARLALTAPPILPSLTDSAGNFVWTQGFINPLARLTLHFDGTIRTLVSNTTVGYQLFPGFHVQAMFAFNQVQNHASSRRGQDYFDPQQWASQGKSLRSTRHLNLGTGTWRAEPQVEYQLDLGPGKLSALLGGTFERTVTDAQNLYVNNYLDETMMGNTNLGTAEYTFTNKTEYSYAAIYGRINYSMRSRYIVNLTARRDGSSRFGPGNKFGNFGAVGAAWLFSEEPFVKNVLPFLNFGKLRGSYGTSGNDMIGDYRFLSLYEATLPYAGGISLTPSWLFNNNFAWEETRKAEVGLDLSLFRERIFLTSSYYRNRSSNQLVDYRLPSITGFTSVQANLPAVIQNTGLEFELSTTNIRRSGFSWSTSFNISFPHNKLVSYPDLESSPYQYTYVEGMSLDLINTYERVRVDPGTGLNVWRSVSRGVDTTDASRNFLTDDDRIVHIDISRKYHGGINNTFRYKQLELNVFFNFAEWTGPENDVALLGRGRAMQMSVDHYERRWKQPGDIADVPRLSNTQAQLNDVGADPTHYGTISFLRLKNLEMAYSLPSAVTDRLKIQGLRFFVQAQNVWTLTGYSGWDVENASSGYPLMKTWTAGINFNL